MNIDIIAENVECQHQNIVNNQEGFYINIWKTKIKNRDLQATFTSKLYRQESQFIPFEYKSIFCFLFFSLLIDGINLVYVSVVKNQ